MAALPRLKRCRFVLISQPILIAFAFCAAVGCIAPLIGSTHIELGRAFAHVSPDYEIFFYARLPRVLLALIAGAALSVTGVLFQCMLRDPLAEPYTLGVSSGASVGAVLAICFGLRATGLLSLAGAGGVLLIVLGIAMDGRRLSSFTLMLAGVTMNSISFAVILFLHNLATFSQSFEISRWLMGGIDAVEYSTLAWLAAIVLPVCALVMWRAREWNLLAIGDDWAASRGVSTTALTTFGYFAGSVLTRSGHIAHRSHRIRRPDRAARAAVEAGRGSSRLISLFVFRRRSVPLHLRYFVSYRDRAHRNSRRSDHRARRRTFFHLAASLPAEEPVAVILVGGGARSGKSRHALELARGRGERLVFLATAQACDAEMEARIAKHRADRGPEFSTIEEPLEIAGEIRAAGAEALVVDCLTLWLSNLMLASGRDVAAEIEKLLDAARSSRAVVILVTNEVGCSIVPESALARDFRDHAGILNQRIASIADEVYWMVFGCPLRVR